MIAYLLQKTFTIIFYFRNVSTVPEPFPTLSSVAGSNSLFGQPTLPGIEDILTTSSMHNMTGTFCNAPTCYPWPNGSLNANEPWNWYNYSSRMVEQQRARMLNTTMPTLFSPFLPPTTPKDFTSYV